MTILTRDISLVYITHIKACLSMLFTYNRISFIRSHVWDKGPFYEALVKAYISTRLLR